MRRITVTFLCVLALAAPVCADTVRIEVGLGGVFPAGGWTHCRITGLDNVTDGDLVIVHVSEMFESHLGVKDGAAEGFILMPDESPMISIEVPRRGRVKLPPEATRHLKGVKDALPAVFLGKDPPTEAEVVKALGTGELFVIRMTAAELAAYPRGSFDWVRLFVLGDLSESEVKLLRKHFAHLSESVLVARSGEVPAWDWLDTLAFTQGEHLEPLSAYKPELAPYLPVPRGSVRPEFYEIFGPPRWPRSVRRDVALYFVGTLGLFALAVVLRAKSRAMRGSPFVTAVVFGLLFALLAHGRLKNPVESVGLFEVAMEGGVETKVISKAVLRADDRGLTAGDLGNARDATPVASYPGQWVERRLVMTRMGELERETPIGSREVLVRHWYGRWPNGTEGLFDTSGKNVWVCESDVDTRRIWPFRQSTVPSGTLEGRFAEYVAGRHHPDARVDAVRRAMLRYWRKHHFRKGIYRIGWTPADTDARHWMAGTLVVHRQLEGPPVPVPKDDQGAP